MRVPVEWRSASNENYKLFRKKHPNIELSIKEWRSIIYTFNELYKEHLLQTGDKAKFPYGFGEFAIVKKKRKKINDFKNKINLPVDWKKTREKGKIIYNFNFHTEGFSFRWHWFKDSARFKHSNIWFFKPSRVTSRLLAHYINADDKYQHIYREWHI